MPISRGKKKVPPLSGINPILEKACINDAERAAITTSQQRAILAPAPAATPFTAAITGLFSSLIFLMMGLYCSASILPIPGPAGSTISARSCPAQKALPLPVR